MAVNIEIKARVRDRSTLRECIEEISDGPAETILQEDIFFHTPKGRLKLRILAPDRGELIYYERDDTSGPKLSHYMISTTTDPSCLKALLAGALGIRGSVRKQRWLYRIGAARIHVDEVDGLGVFLEVEVVLASGQTAGEGETIATELMRRLGVEETELIEAAYIDLLEKAAL